MKKSLLMAMFVVVGIATASFGTQLQFATVGSGQIHPGDSFQVTVSLLNYTGVADYNIYLNSSAAPGNVSVTSYAASTAVFGDWVGNGGFTMPVSLPDVDAVANFGPVSYTGAKTGTSTLLGTLTIATSANIPQGTYTITNFPDYGGPQDAAGADLAADPAIAATFTVVPEPITLVLLSLGGLFLRRRVA